MSDFKVRCVKGYCFAEGNIYEVKDGKITDEYGNTYDNCGKGYKNISDIHTDLMSKFELVEENPMKPIGSDYNEPKADFKVRCVKSNDGSFTTGKIYEVKTGVLSSDTSPFKSRWTKDIESINNFCNPYAHFELVNEPQFTKADLKTGMRVKQRKGDFKIVVKDSASGDFLVGDWWEHLSNFNNDLTCVGIGNEKFDIVEVYDCPGRYDFLKFNVLGKLLWTRPEPKHYTISEAEAKLAEIDGQAVKIGG